MLSRAQRRAAFLRLAPKRANNVLEALYRLSKILDRVDEKDQRKIIFALEKELNNTRILFVRPEKHHFSWFSDSAKNSVTMDMRKDQSK